MSGLPLMAQKDELRRTLLERRRSLSVGEREALSGQAQAVLIAAPIFAAARTIILYTSFRGEVLTDEIVAAAVHSGKRLVLPRVRRDPTGLDLHLYSGDPDALISGAYGIREPAAASPQVADEEIDLVVVPGVAFDRRGIRLGYGGGYYDRTLPRIRAANPQAGLIGLAYSFQVVPALPCDPHDVPVDAIATDEGWIPAKSIP